MKPTLRQELEKLAAQYEDRAKIWLELATQYRTRCLSSMAAVFDVRALDYQKFSEKLRALLKKRSGK
jgi:hypothetical protein